MGPARRARKSRSWFIGALTVAVFGVLALPVFAAATPTGAPTPKPAPAPNPVPTRVPNRVEQHPVKPTTGTLEICASDAHGMTGTPFRFTVNGGAPLTIAGGACSGPITLTAGAATVAESPAPATSVVGIESNHVVAKDVGAGTVTVRVKPGSTPENETLVTFVNRAIAAVGLKVCKVADDLSPSLIGQLFTFTENGGPAFSVAAGTTAAPVCGPTTKYPLGTVVNVSELATPSVHVAAVAVSDGRGSNVDLGAGSVSATIGSGVTVVTYTNAFDPIPQSGFVEVCKASLGHYVEGDFTFTITAPGFSATRAVTVGQCSEAVMVPAGQVTITEATRFPYFLHNVKVVPPTRLVSTNTANQTATVTVPVGDTSTETLVTFTNGTRTGQVKVCKTLTANSAALSGTHFTFMITSSAGPTHTDTVVAGAAGSTACVMDPKGFPLGSTASIIEAGVDNVHIVGVTVAPSAQDAGSAPPTANLTIGTGVTTATFTNEAFGTLEVCKLGADASTEGRSFRFSVNDAAPIAVLAGQCSLGIPVPAGTATVRELGKVDFHLVGVTAVGPASESRLNTGPTDDPANVAVPFGGVENETVVTFTNAVDTGQLKICKLSSEPTLQNVVFQFTYQYSIDGSAVNGSAALKPGTCSGLSAAIPVIDANGNPVPISVIEAPQATVQVSNIAVDNGTLVASDLTAGSATVNANIGNTVVTYTNVRTPFGVLQVCKAAADASTATRTFQFSVDGAPAIAVPAGECSALLPVLSGTVSVEELGTPDFHLVGVAAVGPANDNRLLGAATDNPATVSVPVGGEGNKTVVTFTDAVDTGRLEICEASTEPTLQAVSFTFDFHYDLPGGTVTGSAALEPGQCSAASDPIPVVDANGNPIAIDVYESGTDGVVLTDVGVDNGTLSGTDLATGFTSVSVDTGLTTVTFTNALEPPETLPGSVRHF